MGGGHCTQPGVCDGSRTQPGGCGGSRTQRGVRQRRSLGLSRGAHSTRRLHAPGVSGRSRPGVASGRRVDSSRREGSAAWRTSLRLSRKDGPPVLRLTFSERTARSELRHLSERMARRHSQELQEDALSLRSGSVFPRTVATTALARSARGECESPRSRHRCRPRKPSRHRRQDRTIGPFPGSASAARSAPQLLIAGGQDLAESGSSTGEAPVTTRSRSTRVGTKGTRSAPRSPSAPSRG